jgi:energy-converting hydrogenase Eha subunit C
MSIGIHPIILIAGLCVLLGLVAVILASRARNRATTVVRLFVGLIFIIPSAYILCSAFWPELVDARFRTYKRFYQDIQSGMTKAEVMAVLERHYPSSGPRQRPKTMRDEPDDLGFFMNPEIGGEPNCEGIFLKLQGGRVVSKNYSRD